MKIISLTYAFLFLATLFITAPSAQAGILVEPFLGYETGDIEFNNSSDTDGYSGVSYGARVGLTSFTGFIIGAEYSIGKHERDDEENSSDPKDKVDTTDLGAFIGYQFPLGFRIFATFLLNTKQDFDDLSVDPEGSGGFKVGAGFRIAPLMNLNFIYTNRKATREFTSATDIKSTTTTYGLTLSFPLSLP